MRNKSTAPIRAALRMVIFLCSFMACISVPAAETTAAVRVATYNVEYGKNASPEEIGAMLTPFELDLIGFCEAPDGDWTSRVGAVMGMEYTYVGAISSANHTDKFKSILSRTPLEDTQEITMHTGAVWNPASAVRAVTTIRGVTLAFYSLHIAASDGKTGHAPELAKHLTANETAKRVILVGDFNNRVGEDAIDTIRRAGMQLTWTDLAMDVASRYTYNALKPEINGGVIDHIFYNTASGGKATAGDIIEREKPLSDHKPVWAEITFPITQTP